MVTLLVAGQSNRWLPTLLLLAAGLLMLSFIARSRWVERQLNRVISYALRRWTQLDVRDYVAVLHLQSGYAVTEMRVAASDWLAGKTLGTLRLPDEGVLVLGVIRTGDVYIGAPTGDTEIHSDDLLILYGPIERIQELDQRRAGTRGDKAHQEAVVVHEEIIEEQETNPEPISDSLIRSTSDISCTHPFFSDCRTPPQHELGFISLSPARVRGCSVLRPPACHLAFHVARSQSTLQHTRGRGHEEAPRIKTTSESFCGEDGRPDAINSTSG